MRMRNAEFGMRNGSWGGRARPPASGTELPAPIPHSAFRTSNIPHSALWLPGPLRHRRHERVEPPGREAQRLALLGAHVSRHQELDDLEAVVEGELRRVAPQEHANEVLVFGLIAVRRRLA